MPSEVKRIVYITNFRRGFGGGAGRVAYELAGQFSNRASVLLVCPGDQTGPATTPAGLDLFIIRSHGEPGQDLADLSVANLRRLFDYLDVYGPQVVHAHDAAWLGLAGQLWARMRRVPFVFTAHLLPWRMVDFGNRTRLAVPWPELAEEFMEEYMQQFLAGCQAVIALNQAMADGLREFGYTGRLDTIPNGRDLRRFSACRNASLSEPLKTLVFAGYLSARKNQEYLLQMMACLPPGYRLELLGEALQPAYEQRLRRLCAGLGLEGVVEFAGQVPYREIPARLQHAHLMVSASRHEVQSLSVIEALASGTPVVGLDNETIAELVDERVGARLPAETRPQDFARQVQALCSLEQADYDRLCQDARRRVSRLDWGELVELTAGVYAELAPGSQETDPEEQARLERLLDFAGRAQLPESVRAGLLEWQERLARVRRVPAPTWLYAGLNLLGASFVKLLLKS
jgi:glycosyltransferase involved in cell wall biosynthesis